MKDTRNQKEFSRMVDAYLAGTATAKQIEAIEQYYDLFAQEPDVLESMSPLEIKHTQDRLKAAIDYKIEQRERKTAWLSWRYAGIAASIVLMAALGAYFYQWSGNQPAPLQQGQHIADIAPGSNKAVLTLSNGTQISLDDVGGGEIASEAGTAIHKNNAGQLVYDQHAASHSTMIYNTVATPKGGQYQISLPDGTTVWLNAASVLKYPVHFSSSERKVELTGEAYFEVAKNKAKPFRVITPEQQVEVLGTHFDINAYADEPATRTSLLEGSVKVNQLRSQQQILLVPGQQSILKKGHETLTVKNIDTDEAIAWKNGYFMFDEEPLQSILRKVSRWYDVDIRYQGIDPAASLSFSGTLSRYSHVSKVLKKLELTEAVHFTIEGRTIIVSPYVTP